MPERTSLQRGRMVEGLNVCQQLTDFQQILVMCFDHLYPLAFSINY